MENNARDSLISRLSEIRSQYNCFNESEEPYYHALTEVIKMLSEQADGDTISRQGLKVSLLSEDYEAHCYCFPCKEIMKRIDEQPSAQPEPEGNSIHDLEELAEKVGSATVYDAAKEERTEEHAEMQEWKEESAQNVSNDEPISRKAAIEIVDFECGEWRGLAKTIAERLSALPSAQPEPKKGRWVGIDDEPCETYECDVCGAVYDTVGNTWDLPNYCPSCGAAMTEAEGSHRGFTCHRGHKCMCFQCGENDCERYQSEPPDLTDSLEDELFEQFEKAMKGARHEQRRDCQVSPGNRV